MRCVVVLSAIVAGACHPASGVGETDPPDGGTVGDAGPWLGTLQFGSNDNDSATAILVDAGFEVYVLGATHGQVTPEGDPGVSQWFVSRLASDGARVWTRQLHAGAAVRGALGPDDALYVVGEGGVSRFDRDGGEIWHALDGMNVRDVAVAPDGAVVVGGSWAGGAFPDDATLRPPIGELGGTFDGFVTRLDPSDGRVLSQQQIGTSLRDWVNGLAVGAEGEVYLTGATQGALPGATHFGAPEEGDTFLMRVDADGTPAWAAQFYGGFTQGYAVRLDPTGHPVMVGGRGTGLVSRHDPLTGDPSWTAVLDDLAAVDVAVDAEGRAWVAGSLSVSGTYGFAAVIGTAGERLGMHVFADSPSLGPSTSGDLWGQSSSNAYGVAVDALGYAWVAGDVVGDLEHNVNVSSTTPDSFPGADAFVARLTPDAHVDGVALEAAPAWSSLAVGDAGATSVTPTNAAGDRFDGRVTWASALPAVATVDAGTGDVRAVAPGRSLLVPTLGRISGEPAVVHVGDAFGTALFGTDHGDVPHAVTMDASGDLVVGGWTDGRLHGQEMLGGRDAFLARLDDDGRVVAAVQTGGGRADAIERLVTDTSGNTYAIATLTDALPMDATHTVVVRFDASGAPVWRYEPTSGDMTTRLFLRGITVDAEGVPFVTGSIESDPFILKLDPDTGAEVWRWVGIHNQAPYGASASYIEVDPNGDFVISGFQETTYLGTALKVDATGTRMLWVNNFGSGAIKYINAPRAMAMAPDGDFYLSSATATGVLDDSSGLYRGRNAYIVRVGGDGQPKWFQFVQPAPPTRADANIAALVVDADGNVYGVGSLTGPSGFDGATPAGGFDAILVKFDPDGNYLWGRQLGTPQNDYGTAVTLQPDGGVAIVGYTFGDLDGAAMRGAHTKESCDVFVARFAADGSRL